MHSFLGYSNTYLKFVQKGFQTPSLTFHTKIRNLPLSYLNRKLDVLFYSYYLAYIRLLTHISQLHLYKTVDLVFLNVFNIMLQMPQGNSSKLKCAAVFAGAVASVSVIQISPHRETFICRLLYYATYYTMRLALQPLDVMHPLVFVQRTHLIKQCGGPRICGAKGRNFPEQPFPSLKLSFLFCCKQFSDFIK